MNLASSYKQSIRSFNLLLRQWKSFEVRRHTPRVANYPIITACILISSISHNRLLLKNNLKQRKILSKWIIYDCMVEPIGWAGWVGENSALVIGETFSYGWKFNFLKININWWHNNLTHCSVILNKLAWGFITFLNLPSKLTPLQVRIEPQVSWDLPHSHSNQFRMRWESLKSADIALHCAGTSESPVWKYIWFHLKRPSHEHIAMHLSAIHLNLHFGKILFLKITTITIAPWISCDAVD